MRTSTGATLHAEPRGLATALHHRPLRLAVLFLAIVTAAVFGVGAAPAQAKVTYKGYLTFDKNPQNPQNSTLTWELYRTDLDPPRRTTKVSWRAGSGVGVTNPCTRQRGWLPNGQYSVTLLEGYNGSKIWGTVFRLSDKACKPGSKIKRTELFIHSEMTKSGKQGKTEPQRWDGNGDFKSAGCIKLRPADIKSLAKYYKIAYKPGKTYAKVLTVKS
ncbi:L,D-transpeptidase family protein [Cryptosporangium aurantiacum]|uniref:L,D-TPase catalytic domain-containing protein n=1 Tax=Cryptosporangium aurantiacum TaxID=134849 RepID=A0A1M7RJL7_9ACTN|nr:L,D-transpeptidase family protein [Cryptosporangium aurantiacum]SHN46497.1 hypothetical protein SAMN05443668_11633 [Cryptosporangium aurantiacum]